MSSTHSHSHDLPAAHRNLQGQQKDPTRTRTARTRFAQHLRGRWNAIKFHLRRGIVKNDAFGIGGSDIGPGVDGLASQVDTDDELTPGTGQFDFPSDADAAREFNDWLNDAIEKEILEEYEGDQYVRKGYARGIKNADARLREQGIDVPEAAIRSTLTAPVHSDKLELLYERAFEELDGITQATAQEIRRELVEGLAEGASPREMARNITDRVESVGKTRSTVLARTEVVRAHSESTLTRYQSIAGDVDVTVKAEWITADDGRVCEECAALEGQTFTVEEARGMLPLHPQCRCAWVPAMGS